MKYTSLACSKENDNNSMTEQINCDSSTDYNHSLSLNVERYIIIY